MINSKMYNTNVQSNRLIKFVNEMIPNSDKKNEFKEAKGEVEKFLDFVRIIESQAANYFGNESTASLTYINSENMYRIAFSNENLTKKELYQQLRKFKKEVWSTTSEEYFDKAYIMVD